MTERGVFGVDRGIFDHPLLADDAPFSRREAWIWLIAEAAFKSRRVSIGAALVMLGRGQLAHSLRFIARAWGWSEPTVRRFLTTLKSNVMIDAVSDAGITVITICNYDKYNFVPLLGDALPDAGATQTRRTLEVDGGDARAPDNAIAFEIATEIGIICGYPSPDHWPLGWYGAPHRVRKWIAEGWRRDLIISTVRAVMGKKRDGPPDTINYFEKPIAREHQLQAAPLPIFTDMAREPTHAKPTDQHSVVQAGRRRLAELAELARGQGADGASNDREGDAGLRAGDPAVRLVSSR